MNDYGPSSRDHDFAHFVNVAIEVFTLRNIGHLSPCGTKYLSIAPIRVNTIMQSVLAVAAFSAALCFEIPAGRAFGIEPWCAVVSIGTGNVIWDCQYRSIEECRPNVIAGNRGFCNLNPWYESKTFGPRKYQKRHMRQH